MGRRELYLTIENPFTIPSLNARRDLGTILHRTSMIHKNAIRLCNRELYLSHLYREGREIVIID